jgi:hypothetical protein
MWREWSYLAVEMYKLNVIQFYRLGAELAPLRSAKFEEPPSETYKRLSSPIRWLDDLIFDINYVPARKSRKAATELLDYLKSISDEARKRAGASNPEPVATLVVLAKTANPP